MDEKTAWGSSSTAEPYRITLATAPRLRIRRKFPREETYMQINTDGLIIREQSIGESDRLVTVSTREQGSCGLLSGAPRP